MSRDLDASEPIDEALEALQREADDAAAFEEAKADRRFAAWAARRAAAHR